MHIASQRLHTRPVLKTGSPVKPSKKTRGLQRDIRRELPHLISKLATNDTRYLPSITVTSNSHDESLQVNNKIKSPTTSSSSSEEETMI